jgi:hypothetical protein
MFSQSDDSRAKLTCGPGWFPQCRFNRILQRFVDGSLARFVTVMHETGTVITGSCALNMLLGDFYDSSSSDLNLIVLHGKFSEMTIYVQEEEGYINSDIEERPHSSVASSCSRFRRYHKQMSKMKSFKLIESGPFRTSNVFGRASNVADLMITTQRRLTHYRFMQTTYEHTNLRPFCVTLRPVTPFDFVATARIQPV